MIRSDKVSFNNELINKNLIAFILIISTMTSLRFSFLGLGEVLILAIFFFLIIIDLWRNNFMIKDFVFSKFWIFQLFFMLIGLLINEIFMFDTNSNPVFDMLSYIFIVIACITFERLFYNVDSKIILDTLNRVYILGTIFFYIIFRISKYKNIIFGYNMYFGNKRFSPFSDNPHQFGCLISVFPIIGLKKINMEQSLLKKLIHFLMIIFNIQMGVATGNDTLIVLWISCFFILLYYEILTSLKLKRKRIIFFIITISLIFIIVIASSRIVLDLIYNIFVERDMGGARIKLWINAINAGSKSFLFGLGPGAHSGFYGPYEGVEAHNLFLQLFTQAGIIGVILYLLLLKKLFKLIKIDYRIGLGIIAIFILGLSGSGLRRLVNWIYMILFYYYLKNKEAI